MKKYRIVKHTHFNHERYEVQKRFLGFLWWYNFEFLESPHYGIYESLIGAENVIKAHREPYYKEIAKEYE